MPLLTIDRLWLEFGDQPILRDASLTVDEGERICVIGRNGAGKSTLFRLITGEQAADAGDIRRRQGLRVAQLAQALPAAHAGTVRDFVADGLSDVRALLAEYERLAADAADADAMRRLEQLQREIETADGWQLDQRVDAILSELALPGAVALGALSGGWQRRVALARALVSRPDLLLLDEPTNHLDLASIEWLEHRVRSWPGTVMFITHDRAFLQRLATRIVELDRARLTSWPGDYANFLRRKEETLNAEALETGRFEKKLAEEEVWVRQGIKARRTRNEGRVRALEAMRREYTERQRFRPQREARFDIDAPGEVSGRLVFELEHVTHGFDGEPLIRDLSLRVMRGDRIALVGNNGVGKSTLLKLMLGEIEPQTGRVRRGTKLEVAYFDQHRSALDDARSVADIVADGRDHVDVGGRPRHVISYLADFLFSPARTRTPVGALSGGERNRVLLAKLFTRASNLLVLDEPTNDLDVETLEVLEARLVDYSGTLIVVSHDRAFIDNVVTSTLVFESDGMIRHHAGGYSDWARLGRTLAERERPPDIAARSADNDGTTASNTPADEQTARGPQVAGETRSDHDTGPRAAPRKLSYRLQRELDGLPARIETLEQTLAALDARIAAEDFFSLPYEQTQPVLAEREARAAELEALLERWLELADE